jgi:hypothetical protein
MPSDPWTESDPGGGDFDVELASIDPRCVETHGGDPDARLRILVSVERDDAERLERITEARGQKPGRRGRRPAA